MATIKVFKCIRPKEDLASKIAALPYDVYNTEEARKVVEKNPYSFLKIDRAETMFDPAMNIDPHSTEVYEKSHDELWKMISNGEFIKDETSGYYIYQLTMNGRTQTGIVGCASIDDYNNNVIKKHENTLSIKEQDRIDHIDACNAQTGPIFLAYPSNKRINDLIAQKKKEKALYDFTSDDGIRHTVWKISEIDDILTIYETFLSIKSIYIADGHHRAASAVKIGLRRRSENKRNTGREDYNYFLSVLFPDDELMIMDYNRVVKDLNNYSKEEFLDRISHVFNITPIGKTQYKPDKKGNIGMFLDNQWYKLEIKSEFTSDDPVKGLDVSILQDRVLDPILNIKNPKNDKRIDFIGGIRGLSELEKRVNTDMKVAFAMYPTSIKELFAVADAGLLMPPKSTWFEPKLRSGIFIHEI